MECESIGTDGIVSFNYNKLIQAILRKQLAGTEMYSARCHDGFDGGALLPPEIPPVVVTIDLRSH